MTLRLNGSTSGYVEIDAPAVAANNTLTLPSGGELVAATSGNINVTSINSLNYPTAGALSNRNKIINGDMRIDQRNAGASVNSASGGGVYAVDRFEQESAVGGGVMSIQRSSTAPAGFTNSLLFTVTTADTSLAAGDKYDFRQIVEGHNSADLGFGSATPSTVTLSFWVRSSVTGTYCVALRNGSNNRSYVTTYAINAANTWEQKSVTITGDTTGTWGTDNGRGIIVGFSLGSGSSFQATANTWSAGEYRATSSQTNLLATNGATFYITGVQLEAGTVATPFERRSYGQELALCQRYYQALGLSAYSEKFPTTSGTVGNATIGTSTNTAVTPINFPVPMRAVATIVFAGVTSTTGEIRNSATGTTYPVTGYEATSKGLININATGIASGTPLHYQFTATAEL